MRKKGNIDRYTRLGVFSLEDIFDYVFIDENGIFMEDTHPIKRTYNGYSICLTSARYRLFKLKGTVCVHCGVVGTFFSLDLPRTEKRPHFNLYGLDKNGIEVMLTKDHILPRSKGGTIDMDNLQPMCERCNCKKGNKIEESMIEDLLINR